MIKKMRYVLLSLILVLFSCKKGTGNFTIKGVITDNSFNKGLDGASASLYQVTSSNSNKVLISSTALGSDGSYSFVFKRDKIEKYILTVSKNNYFDLEETIPFASLSLSEDNIKNYSTTAKAWVRLKFFNNSPAVSDQLDFTKQQGKSPCSTCAPTSQQTFLGAIDTSLVYVNDGNTTFSYLYSVFGTANQGIKSAVTVPFDTTEIYLLY